jgi:ATP-dependent DNA ligase
VTLVRYLIVAEAYRDLEQVSSRLALTERLAVLLAQTPAGLLPTVCYLSQGLIAPEFAGLDLGLAEKLAIRAVATAAGTDAASVAALVRETGDLGQAAERLLALPGSEGVGLAASLEVTEVVRTLRGIAVAEGAGSQGRKLELLAGLLGQATPLEARYLLRLGHEGAAVGHRHAHHFGRAGPGHPADGRVELFTRRLEEISGQFPDVVELLAGVGPAEVILEGEVVAYDAAAGELRPFGEVMLRRRKHGIDQAVRDVPVGLFCFELLYADGQDLTMLPYPQRRAALEAALTPSLRLRLTTAAEITGPAALDAMFAQAVTDGCEGLVCKSTGPDSAYQAGARGWQWIKLKRDYRTELSDTADLVVIGAFFGRGRRAGVYGAVLLAAYDADAGLFRAVTKCGAGFSDADLAALPARLAPLLSPNQPVRVDARQEPDVWFEPGLVLEILSAGLTLSPNYPAAWGQIQDDAGLAMRFPRFTGRWRDDKAPEDATTTRELAELFLTARPAS